MQNVVVTVEEWDALRQAATERDALLEVEKECDALRGELRVVTVERDLLKERVQAYLHQLYAARSEARSTGQKDLFFNEAEALVPPASTEPAKEDESGVEVAGHQRKKRGGRKPLDPALPRDVVRHELPESERICPHDGSMLVEIGAAISEQLDIIPQQVRVIQHQRIKYACPCCDSGIKVTPAAPRLIPKGLLTEAALAWIVTAKYQDGLPLYRQAALLRRFGGDLSRNMLAASVVRIGCAVHPIINLMRDVLLESALVYGDETELQVLKEPGRAPQTTSYLWAQMNGTGPPVRLFGYSPGRGTGHALKLYAGMAKGGALMTYQPIVTSNSKLGRALAYLRGQWPKLARYVENGHWPIDNNPCENAIHPFVVGRKGRLFADTVGGAPPASICIPSSRLARPITSIRTPIWSNCCAHCRWQRRQMTTRRCFPGKSPSQLPASNRGSHM
jgi:transposase